MDTENCIFNESWTDAFVFTFDTTSQKPTCLICQAIVAVKAANLKRHHETKHSEFVGNFPIASEARKNKVQGLQGSRTRQVRGLARVVWPSKKPLLPCMALEKKHLSSLGLGIRACSTDFLVLFLGD